MATARSELFQSWAMCADSHGSYRTSRQRLKLPSCAAIHTIFCHTPTFIEKVMQGYATRTCGDFHFFTARTGKVHFPKLQSWSKIKFLVQA